MLERIRKVELGRYSIFLVLALVFGVASLLSENFLTATNLTNVLRQVAVITILAYGAMTLIIGGMIDLSAGAVMAFAGVVSVLVYKDTGSMALAIAAGIAIGVVCNLANAFLVASCKTPAFIVTLGMMMVARGAVLELTQGQNVLQLGDFVQIGQGQLGPVPLPAVFLVVITIGVWYLMTQTRFGRSVYAVGGSAEAARAAGVPVQRVQYQAFILNGVLVGFAGVLFMARVNAGLPNAGIGFELQAITAPIVGGTSFSGGVGTTAGTLAGALIIGLLSNIMNLIGVGSYVQQMVMGLIIVVAVAYDVWSRRGRRMSTTLQPRRAADDDDASDAGVGDRASAAPPGSRSATP